MRNCIDISVKADVEYSAVSLKLFDQNVLEDPYCREIFAEWECLKKGITDYRIVPNLSTNVYGLGIMALNDVEDFSRYKSRIYSITFHMKP